MHNCPLHLHVRPARRTREQLLRDDLLVVPASRPGSAKLRIEPLEQRLPGGVLPVDSAVTYDELPEFAVNRRTRLEQRPAWALLPPGGPLIARGSAKMSWALADRWPSAPAVPQVQFVSSAPPAPSETMIIMQINADGRFVGQIAPAQPFLNYPLSRELEGWASSVSAA